jgi:hypothetical protein
MKGEDTGLKSCLPHVRCREQSGLMSLVSCIRLRDYLADYMPDIVEGNFSAEEVKTRVLIEKKTAINLLEAFAVAVKHYLRGEEGSKFFCCTRETRVANRRQFITSISTIWSSIYQATAFHQECRLRTKSMTKPCCLDFRKKRSLTTLR